MSPLQTIPRAEAIIGGYLRAHPDLVAVDARVGGRTPATMSRPWVRVTQLDASDSTTSSIEHLIEYLLQLDCYAGQEAMDAEVGQTEALDLAVAVRAVLKAAQGQILDGIVVTSVDFNGMPRIPDTDFEPARERYVLTASIRMHR